MLLLKVLEIQRFSLHDGPGIRTTVFFKGCPLKCTWCHNAESQQGKNQLSFDAGLCQLCGACVQACKNKLHRIDDQIHLIYFASCQTYGDCIGVCDYDALKLLGREYNVDDLAKEVLKDKSYYDHSGGGVTFSGGEPLEQGEALLVLAEALKKENIHTCLDTSGYAEWNTIRDLLPFIDLIHYDYKITDSVLHKKLTGKSNRLIIENLHKINEEHQNVLLRCPIVPGINDNQVHFEGILTLAESLACVQGIDLLPYHNFGNSKARKVGAGDDQRLYTMPTQEQKDGWRHFFTRKATKNVTIK